jgi:glucokinase
VELRAPLGGGAVAGLRVGVDLGGSVIKAAGVDPSGRVVVRADTPTPRTGAETVLAEMARLARRVAGGGAPEAVGVAVPGVVDLRAQRVKFLPNVPGAWEDRAVAEELGGALGLPCRLLNDVRAATLAEWRLGAGRGCRHLVVVAVGTGIGGGLVLDGKLYLGSGGHAGEVGHQVLELSGPLCGCGARGCAEALASGPALVAAAARMVAQGIPTALRAACGGDLGRLTPRLVAETAEAGDPVARRLLEEEAARLGALLANLVVLLNPERVVLGGGLAQAGEVLLAGVRRAMEERAGWLLRHAGPVAVVPAALGEWAGAVGAALWAAEGETPRSPA